MAFRRIRTKSQDIMSSRRRWYKKNFDNFLQKIKNDLTISWEYGVNIANVIEHIKDPTIKESIDITSKDNVLE